jgi:hypothetical protein
MKLNIFAGWVGYLAVLGSFFSLAGGLVAAGTGHTQLAIIAGIAFVFFAGMGIAVVGSTVHYDHTHHRDIPHFIE